MAKILLQRRATSILKLPKTLDIKNFAKFISHYEYLCNFVFGEHSDKSFCL